MKTIYISFVFRQWLPLLSSLLLLRNRTKRFRQKFATFCFCAEIRRLKRHVCFLFGVLYNKWYIDHNFQRTKNCGPVSGGRGCKDLSCEKNVWERGGSTSTSKTEVTVRSCFKKQFEKKALPKALKFSDCRERIRRQIQPSYKKS